MGQMWGWLKAIGTNSPMMSFVFSGRPFASADADRILVKDDVGWNLVEALPRVESWSWKVWYALYKIHLLYDMELFSFFYREAQVYHMTSGYRYWSHDISLANVRRSRIP